MKVNVSQTLKTMDGQTTLQDINSEGVAIDATVKMAIVNGLLSPVEKEVGVEKVKKYELAKKVFEADEVDLNEDEIAIIKARVGDAFAPIIVGQIFALLKV